MLHGLATNLSPRTVIAVFAHRESAGAGVRRAVIRPLACILLLALLIGAAPATNPATAPAAPAAPVATTSPATLTFTDDAQTFFVSVPATWRAGKLPRGRGGMLLVGPAPKDRPSAAPLFRVQAGRQVPGQAEMTLEQFAREAAYQVTGKLPDDVKIEPAHLGGVGGVEARQFRHTLKDAKGIEVEMHYIIILQQPRSFLFTYLQEKDVYDPALAKAIFDSVRWKPAGDAAK